MLILGIMVTGLVAGFMQSEKQAEWASYSLAAQSLAMQPTEQVRGAKWDQYANPPTNAVIINNFPVRVEILDIPITGTNIVYATNRTVITDVYPGGNPPLKKIYVECTWRFLNRGMFTNSVTTYRAPDQ